MSIVKRVDAELKMDVRSDIRAASMTASITPLRPSGMMPSTSAGKAVLREVTLMDSTMNSLFYSENFILSNIDQNDEYDNFLNAFDDD